MPNRREFLDLFAAEAKRSHLPADADRLLAEAEGHLDDSIQARLELGMLLEAAECEAIAAFGSVKSAARANPPRHRMHWFAATLSVILLQLVGVICLSHLMPMVSRPFVVATQILGLLTSLGFARACFRARRPASFSLVMATIFSVASAVAYVRGVGHGGFGMSFRETFFSGASPILNFLYEMRGVAMILVGFPVGIDLLFGSLGVAAFRLRRRTHVA